LLEPLPLLAPLALLEDFAFFEPLVLVEILQAPGSASPLVAEASGVLTQGSVVTAGAPALQATPASIRPAITNRLLIVFSSFLSR
jgi:ABC-type nitrate/sulfonate/bicarbonate transport system substrate-binding protein